MLDGSFFIHKIILHFSHLLQRYKQYFTFKTCKSHYFRKTKQFLSQCEKYTFPSKSKNVHHTRLWHNKKLAGLVLDNDIGVPQLPHELLSNGGRSGGIMGA